MTDAVPASCGAPQVRRTGGGHLHPPVPELDATAARLKGHGVKVLHD